MHNYPDTGYYTVTLVMTDTSACNSIDSVKHVIKLSGFNVSATFTIPDSVCLGTAFTPSTVIHNATTVTWEFGDGSGSTVTAPTHTFTAVGTYTVTVVVDNPGACNGSDTFRQIIKVIGAPIADFSFVPITPEANVPTSFTNMSVNAVRYSWDFGDATSSIETNPVHQYNKTGTYRACLTAYNNSNCPSVACKEVPADVVPIIGLPSGFSPNGDGENDILYVRGAAIKTLDLKIYNRWGELIFETTSKNIGWDGSYKGQPQPIDAYAYVLSVSFIDETSKLLKGNITLLR
jgi:gliding motility-associated-like protein